MPSSESALVVLVPEAEAVVKPFRDQYDPSAAAGMPAHITLLYPFQVPDEVDQMTLDRLRDCFACLNRSRSRSARSSDSPTRYCIWPRSPMNRSANSRCRFGICSRKRLPTAEVAGHHPSFVGGSTRERTTARRNSSRLRDGIPAQIADPRDRVQSRFDGHPVWALER